MSGKSMSQETRDVAQQKNSAKPLMKNAEDTVKSMGESIKSTAESLTNTAESKTEEVKHTTSITSSPKIQRPKITKTMFYYSTTKDVYMYTRKLWLVSSMANFGETCANTVLTKISGKNLSDVDQNLLVPVFSRVDDTVDSAMYMLIERLEQGQNFVLNTKTKAVGTAYGVANKTIETVYNAKDYSYKKASAMTNTAVSTAKSTANYLYTWVPFVQVHVETGAKAKA